MGHGMRLTVGAFTELPQAEAWLCRFLAGCPPGGLLDLSVPPSHHLYMRMSAGFMSQGDCKRSASQHVESPGGARLGSS